MMTYLLLCLAQDISPDMPNGTVRGRACTAGVMYALAGDDSTLVGVSMNAGVWRSDRGGPWKQLPRSPRYATSIASRDSLLLVGERWSDAVRPELDRTGVWESRDGGANWEIVHRSGAVPAVLIAAGGTSFAATAEGVARRSANARSFQVVHRGRIWALAESETADGKRFVWARTSRELLKSADDGKTWTVFEIPATVDGYGTSGRSRGDLFSLAAFGETAVLLFVPDPRTEKAKLKAFGNHNAILVTDGRKWRVQVLDSGNGTGLGGRRSLRAFVLDRADLRHEVGQRVALFFNGGQDVLRAKGLDKNGDLIWERLGLTQCGEPGADPIHPDLWDTHVPPSGEPLRVGSDGGVHVRLEGKWRTHNEGLHTHHIHTLTLLSGGRMVYSTSDNSEFFRDPSRGWRTWDMTGDANWTAGDAANPALALVVRHASCAHLTDFEFEPPAGAQRTRHAYSTIHKEAELFGPRSFRFIQTPVGEEVPPLLDAVMLATRDGKRVLLRNRRFAASPDIHAAKPEDWEPAESDLPAGATAFWVSGGHKNPVFLVQAQGSLFRRDGTDWKKLPVGDLVDGYAAGPAHVNPYGPDIFVLTSKGVVVSRDGGKSFRPEEVLTALITGSGKYPITGHFGGGNHHEVVLASRANAMPTLSDIAFIRERPREAVAASPFTGVFHFASDEVWRDLTPSLPKPFTPVSSVAFDAEAVYVATEGRSLFRIPGYQKASMASYFSKGVLRSSDGHPLPRAEIRLRWRDGERRERTTSEGRIPLGGVPSEAPFAVEFTGTDAVAGCEGMIGP